MNQLAGSLSTSQMSDLEWAYGNMGHVAARAEQSLDARHFAAHGNTRIGSVTARLIIAADRSAVRLLVSRGLEILIEAPAPALLDVYESQCMASVFDVQHRTADLIKSAHMSPRETGTFVHEYMHLAATFKLLLSIALPALVTDYPPAERTIIGQLAHLSVR